MEEYVEEQLGIVNAHPHTSRGFSSLLGIVFFSLSEMPRYPQYKDLIDRGLGTLQYTPANWTLLTTVVNTLHPGRIKCEL
jgi:hypothetical protein